MKQTKTAHQSTHSLRERFSGECQGFELVSKHMGSYGDEPSKILVPSESLDAEWGL